MRCMLHVVRRMRRAASLHVARSLLPVASLPLLHVARSLLHVASLHVARGRVQGIEFDSIYAWESEPQDHIKWWAQVRNSL